MILMLKTTDLYKTNEKNLDYDLKKNKTIC